MEKAECKQGARKLEKAECMQGARKSENVVLIRSKEQGKGKGTSKLHGSGQAHE